MVTLLAGIFIKDKENTSSPEVRQAYGTDRERNIALLEKLIGVPKEKRKIKFITAIALSDGNTTICKEGIIEGYVANELRGNNGCGDGKEKIFKSMWQKRSSIIVR